MFEVARLVLGMGVDPSGIDSGMTEAERKLDEAGKRLEGIGKGLTAAVTLPIVAAGGASAKLATDFETSFATIQNLVGITGGDLEELRGHVLRLSGETAKSPQELADALFVVTSAGLRGAEAAATLEQAAKASAVGLGDTASIARTVAAATTAFADAGLTAADATDIMFATVREGNLEADQLAGALGRVLPIASSMGLGFDEVGASIATYTRQGRTAAEATTGLQQILNGMLKPSSEAEKAAAALGTSFDEMRASVRERGLEATLRDLTELTGGNEVAMSRLFGSVEAVGAILGTAGTQGEAYTEVAKNISASTGLVDDGFAAVGDTAQFKFNAALASLQATGIKIGSVLLPILGRLADSVAGVADWFGSLSETTQKTIMMIGGVAAAIGPMLMVAGRLASSVAALRTAFVAFQTIALGPIGLAIGAVVAAGVLLYKNWDSIVAWARTNFPNLGSIASGALESIRKTFEAVVDKITVAWGWFGDELISGITTAFVQIGNVLATSFEVILGIWDAWAAIFRGDWSGAWDAIKGIFASIWNGVKNVFRDALNGILGMMPDFVRDWLGLPEQIAPAFEAVTTAAETTQTSVGDLGGAATKFKESVGDVSAALSGPGGLDQSASAASTEVGNLDRALTVASGNSGGAAAWAGVLRITEEEVDDLEQASIDLVSAIDDTPTPLDKSAVALRGIGGAAHYTTGEVGALEDQTIDMAAALAGGGGMSFLTATNTVLDRLNGPGGFSAGLGSLVGSMTGSAGLGSALGGITGMLTGQGGLTDAFATVANIAIPGIGPAISGVSALMAQFGIDSDRIIQGVADGLVSIASSAVGAIGSLFGASRGEERKAALRGQIEARADELIQSGNYTTQSGDLDESRLRAQLLLEFRSEMDAVGLSITDFVSTFDDFTDAFVSAREALTKAVGTAIGNARMRGEDVTFESLTETLSGLVSRMAESRGADPALLSEIVRQILSNLGFAPAGGGQTGGAFEDDFDPRDMPDWGEVVEDIFGDGFITTPPGGWTEGDFPIGTAEGFDSFSDGLTWTEQTIEDGLQQFEEALGWLQMIRPDQLLGQLQNILGGFVGGIQTAERQLEGLDVPDTIRELLESRFVEGAGSAFQQLIDAITLRSLAADDLSEEQQVALENTIAALSMVSQDVSRLTDPDALIGAVTDVSAFLARNFLSETTQIIQVNLDGQIITETVARGLPAVLEIQGL